MQREQRRAASGEKRNWVVALVIFCLGILGFGIFYSTNTISDPAYLAGEYLVYAVPLWGVFYAVFLQKRGATVSGIAFTFIYAALLVGGLIAASDEKQQAREALSTVQREISRAMGASVDTRVFPEQAEGNPATTETEGNPATTETEGNPATTPQPRDVLGDLERLMKEFVDRINSQQHDYLLELEAIGWKSVLDVQRIKNDPTLSESKTIVKRAKVIVDNYERKTSDLLQNTRASISSLNMPESSKEEALASFERGMGRASQQFSKQWKLEKQVVLEVEKIFVLLAASKSWVIEGGSIVFNNDEIARYNAYIENIQLMAQQQQQAQKEGYAEVSRYLDSLGSASR